MQVLAQAKVNLCLHVEAPDHRGYHPLQSLVTFADIGDDIRFTDDGEGPLLTIDGPFSAGLGAGEGNLILKALRRFEAETGTRISHRVHLSKNLPLAAGVGGGSADAGAVLRGLRALYAPDMPDDRLEAIAASTGADGVMCLWSRPAMAQGYGEKLRFVSLPTLACVLINPLVASPTPAVYAAYDRQGVFPPSELRFEPVQQAAALIDCLKQGRNDLESPAVGLNPVIGEVLASLRAQPQTQLARVSGSGATCFALCASDADAHALADALSALWPEAWIRACRLG
ncbi:4-(cytidine 5'-diphospho)-2-C-methyl-D-erythritol kinase [Asticcacaulis tiandongensis]|uniref:4-(cytidine 5'-diphospho)-2-C-methyl-D-erythritol kinase n=1 Tax=Asticcacaulis tiandongensis TaxID=2565365 RepID=UPI001126B7E9|nr:4-(cytidine 5'-diphospho)-2-C-methyl-D-erythritol kinase [Asticcacaulis tiandongensis]